MILLRNARATLLLIVLTLCPQVLAQGETPVFFGDTNLKSAVIEALARIGIETTAPTPTEMLSLHVLEAKG